MSYLIHPSLLAVITILAEAEGEEYLGKVAVAESIRDRAKFKYNSDGTIAGTIAKRYQYSFFNDDKGDNQRLIRVLNAQLEDKMVQDCIKAWQQAEGGSSVAGGALLYCRTDLYKSVDHPVWATVENFILCIGNHSFFKEKS